ncbi:MAG: CdvA-like protein [Candidatus Bathyarchaeia archaeon]|nr:CdvA-like protein [Candidatus Bathyarchaeota archaeon]
MKAEEIRPFIGKPVTDIHKRQVGRIIGYYANTRNEATSVELELVNGDFVNTPVNQIEITGDAVYYIQPWELEAESLKKQFDLIIRRIKALDELRRNGDIDEAIYEELRRQHSSSVEELKEQREVLLESLNERMRKLDNQIKELEIFLANSKMQHTSGEINDQAYKTAYEAVNNGLNRAISEKNHLRELTEFLKNAEFTIQRPGLIREEERQASTPIGKIPDIVYVKMREEAI